MNVQRRTTLTLLLAGLLLATAGATGDPTAEPIHVVGRVVTADTGSPLQGVRILLEGTGLGTLTDADGRYRLDVLPEQLGGNPRLIAVLIGFTAEEISIPLGGAVPGGTLTIDFALTVQPMELEEPAVTGAPAQMSMDKAVGGHRVAASEVRFRHDPRPDWNREQYAHIEENRFRATHDHPLSTFSIDVDRASYSNVRRFLLRERRLPPVDAVQIEEMINYFSYSYARPRGDAPVAVTTEVGAAPWAPSHRLLRVGLASRPIDTEKMPPANLVFLLDVSGSMNSPDKLPLVQSSMRLLVEQLRPEDRVSIVVYAGAAGLVLEPTSGAQKDRILEAIDRLHAGGSTAGGAGLRLAYEVARRNFRRHGNNRVILATDGDFNVGESSDAAMIRLIEEKRSRGTFLTVLGFGTGNLQSEKMQSLAQHGNGNYGYIDGLMEARKILVAEMGSTLLTVAKDVKVQVEFNPEQVRAYRLLGYENRLLANEDFNDDAKDAGDLGAGHTVTALYEIVPVGADSEIGMPGVDPLRYQTPPRVTRRAGHDELAFVKVRYKRPQGSTSRLIEHPVRDSGDRVSEDFTFAAAVAGFGMLLRESEYRGSINADRVLSMASDCLGDDPGGYRQGFVEMVRAYRDLTGRFGMEDGRR
jgi:Ca-activated chloride channel family protein